MFFGYNTDHGDDVYCMWNPDTKHLLRSQDIQWLRRYYFDKTKSNPSAKVREDVSVTSCKIDIDTDDTDIEKSEDKSDKSDSDDLEAHNNAEEETETGDKETEKKHLVLAQDAQ